MTLDALDRLQASLEAIQLRYATALRDAVADFNAAPLTPASIDWFRARVLAIADLIAEPFTPGHSVKVPELRPLPPLIHAVRDDAS